jgi:hypothetical protein
MFGHDLSVTAMAVVVTLIVVELPNLACVQWVVREGVPDDGNALHLVHESLCEVGISTQERLN